MMDSLEFTEEEIRQQLELLGYTNICKEKLQGFKKDLDRLIRSGEWTTLLSPENSQIHSTDTSPPAVTKEKVSRCTFNQSGESFFLHPQIRDHDVRVLCPQNRDLGPQPGRFDSYAHHSVAPKPPVHEVGRPNRLQTETDPEDTLQTDSYMSTPGSSQGRRFIKRKVLRKHKGQSLVCDESIYSEDSALSHLLLGSHSLQFGDKMYKMQRGDSEDSTGSSFWSDRESKDEEEDGIRSEFKQKGTKMESIQGAMEKEKANRLSQQQDGKSNGSEERIESWVAKKGCNGSSLEDSCKDENILKKRDQNLTQSSENGETIGSGEEHGSDGEREIQDGERKIVGQKEEALEQEELGEEERSEIGEDSSENVETSGDEDEERIGNVRTAAKSRTRTGDSRKDATRRKKWRDFSDDSSMNGETSSDDGDEVRVGQKSLCLDASGNSKESRGDSLESGRSSGGDGDEEEAESEPGMLEEGYEASTTSNTDSCHDEEKIEECRDVPKQSLDIEKATESCYDSPKNAKNLQNFKKQREETMNTWRKSEFSSENAHWSSDSIEYDTDYEEEKTRNHEEFLKEGHNSSSTSSSRDEKKCRKAKNVLENERTDVRDGTGSRSDNGRNGKKPEKRDTSSENTNCSSDVDGSSADKMDDDFEEGEAEAKTEPRILEEGNICTTSNTDSCNDKKKLKICRDFTGGSSENAKTFSSSNDEKSGSDDEGGELEDLSKPGIAVRGGSFVANKKLKKQQNFYDDSSGDEETSSNPSNGIDNGEDAAEILQKGLVSTSEESMADEKKLEKRETSSENEQDKAENIFGEDTTTTSGGFLGATLKGGSNFGEESSENGCCGEKSAIEKEDLGGRDRKSHMYGDLAAESSGNQETSSEIGLKADKDETDELGVQMQGLKPDLNAKSWTEDEKMFEDRSSENVSTSSNNRTSGNEEKDEAEREFIGENSTNNRDSQNECKISRDFAEASVKKSDDFMYATNGEKNWMKTNEMDIPGESAKRATSAEDINNGLQVALEEERLEIAENSDCESTTSGNFGDKCTATARDSLNLEKGDQSTEVDLAEDGAENGRTSGLEECCTGEKGKVEIVQEIQGDPSDFRGMTEEEKLDRSSKQSHRNAETWEASGEDSEEIERWFEEETLAEKQDEINQQSDSERQHYDQIKVGEEGSTSVSPATSLMTSGYGTYRSEKQDGRHNIDDDDDRLTIAEFDKESLYSFGVCEQDVGEIRGLALGNKLDQEKEMGDEDEFWDGTKSENGVECERGGRVEAELCLEKAESNEDDEDSSNKDIKFIDSKVDQSRTSHKRMYEEWEGNLRPPTEGASCLEERLAGLHLSTSVQHESENEDLTSHGESPSSESLSEGAFESYVRGMSRSHSDGDIRPKPKSFIRPVLGPTGPKKTDPVAKYFQYKQLWDLFKLPGENDRKALRWEIKERLAYQPPPPKPRKVLAPNTYTVPTEKKRSALRWEIRNDLASGNLPHSYNYRF